MAEAAEVKGWFFDSLLASFFPDLNTEAGHELVIEVAAYLLECYPKVFKCCPSQERCFAIHWIADYLVIMGAEINVGDECADKKADGSSLTLTTPSVEPVKTLKSKSIGDKKCDYEILADASLREAWRKKWMGIYDNCGKPSFTPVGTFKPQTKRQGCCDV